LNNHINAINDELQKKKINTALLLWYDSHARDLPWRIPPSKSISGLKQDPYKVWLSEIMLQQTTVATVIPYFNKFTAQWKNIEELAKARENKIMEAWAGLGYYSRARNLIKCSHLIFERYDSIFPKQREELLKLPGVGPYTAAAIQSIAFGQKATVIDGNIERIIVRLYTLLKPVKYLKTEIKNIAASLTPEKRCGDYAQSLMDLGATICTPKKPKCDACPINSYCSSYGKGIEDLLPSKISQSCKVTRYGYAFVAITSDYKLVMERRPPKGLLGGMLSFPCSEWPQADFPKFIPPFFADWTVQNQVVTHKFTHFELKLRVAISYISTLPDGFLSNSIDNFDSSKLPSLMRKVYVLAKNCM
jgi:A/G-specific adenine glycosylase